MELEPITPTTLATSREDEESRQHHWPVDGPREVEPRVALWGARPRDIPQEVALRVRPRSISGNSGLVDGNSHIIISPEEISLDPCTVGKETPLEEGSFPVAFGKYVQELKYKTKGVVSVGLQRRQRVMQYSLPHLLN